MSDICSKANRKVSALTRVAESLPFEKRRIHFKDFIEILSTRMDVSWMFHEINDNINKLHERARVE